MSNTTYPERMEIVRSHQIRPPVQTVPLARALGLEVFHANNWPDDLSGMIVKEPKRESKTGYVIYVNKRHHVNRRRFTTAHEIAHFILHEKHIGDGITDDALYRSRLTGGMEAEANRLAADILMPWHLLQPLLAQESPPTLSSLAHLFQVSESAMSIRTGVPV